MTANERPSAADRRRHLTRLYTGSAAGYEEIWAPQLLPLSRKLLEHLPLRNARMVLDGAAGVGTLLPDLQQRAPQAFVVGSDLTLGMLARAPSTFGRVAGDAAHLPFRDEIFDVAVLAFVLFHLFAPSEGLEEAVRVLRPGGTAGTTTWGVENDPPAYTVWSEELEAHGAPPLRTDLVDDEPVESPSKMIAMMESAGLRDIRSWVGEHRMTTTADEFIEHRTKHGQSRWRFEQLDEDAATHCLDQARARLGALPPEAFLEVSEVVYAVGHKP